MDFDPDAFLAAAGVPNPVPPSPPDAPAAGQDLPQGMASTFADPGDRARFRAAKRRGLSDRQAFAVGDNGVGSWGADTTSQSVPMVALPRDLLAAYYGHEDAGHGGQVEILGADGQTFTALIADKMPATGHITNGANIDLNPAAAIRAGHPGGVAPVRWRFVDKPRGANPTGAAEPDFDPDSFLARVGAPNVVVRPIPRPASPAPATTAADPDAFDPDAFLARIGHPAPVTIPGIPDEDAPEKPVPIPGLPDEEPSPSAGHRAANALREAAGGVASGELSLAEGFNRLAAGQNSATPASVDAFLDKQIADRQKALDTIAGLPDYQQDPALVQRITSELKGLQAKRDDHRLLSPGDAPGLGSRALLDPRAQTAAAGRIAAANETADTLRATREEEAGRMFGQDPALKDTALARGARAGGETLPLIGASLVPGVGAVAAAGTAGLQAKAHAYDEYFDEAKGRGESDEQARAGAQQYSDAAALRTVPEMAAFLGTGKLAAGVVNKLLSPSAPAAVRALVSSVAATAGNAAAGTANQLVEQAAAGKPLDASYSLERGVQDALFGVMHGIGETRGAAAARGTEARRAMEAERDASQSVPAAPRDNVPLPTVNDPASQGQAAAETMRRESQRSRTVPEVVREPVTLDDADPEVTGGEGQTTSTQNHVTAQERADRGFAPAEQAARRDFGAAWDDAKATLQDDPTAGQRLVEEINATPRATTDQENALLLHEQIRAQAEHDAATQAVNEAPDDAARVSAQSRLASARDNLFNLYEATKKAGTETGRGLNARKMLARQDYTLSNMLNRRRAANDGQPLTVRQTAEVEAAHEKVAEAQAKVTAHSHLVDEVDAHLAGDPDWTAPVDEADEAEAQHRQELTQEARVGVEEAGGVELLDAVRDAGGLPTEDPVYQGELHTIRENSAPVGQANRAGTFNLFRRSAPPLDELTSRMRAHGFDVETPGDLLELVNQRVSSRRPEYGFAARAEAQSGPAGSEAYFRRQPVSPPRTPAELREEQQRYTRALRAVEPGRARRLEVVKQAALDSLWGEQRLPTAEDGSSPHAATLDGAVYLSAKALAENSPQVNRVNLLHELAHHFEKVLPLKARLHLENQMQREMASGRSPLHDAKGKLHPMVDPRAAHDFSEWLPERLAWDNDAHFAGKIEDALVGRTPAKPTPTARLAETIRNFVDRVWHAVKPGINDADVNAHFRAWLGRGKRLSESRGGEAQAAVRPRPDYVQAVREFFAGRLPANAVLEIGRPGEILRRAGLEDLPIRLSQRVLRRKTGKHAELSPELIERLPALINRPTLVYDTPGDPTGKGIITSHQYGDGKTLTMFANLKVDGDQATVYNVKSLYGKISDELLRELQGSPRIGYADPQEAPAWARHSASQAREPFPQLPALLDKINAATRRGEGQAEPQAAVRRTRLDDHSEQELFAGRRAAGFDEAERGGRTFVGGTDGKPRFEINDRTAKVVLPDLHEYGRATDLRLGDVLKHDALYKEYPELRQLSVRVTKDAANKGAYHPPGSRGGEHLAVSEFTAADPAQARSTLLHEIQHAIQEREDFARGGSSVGRLGAAEQAEMAHPDTTNRRWDELHRKAQAGYQAAPGEIEARAVQARADLTLSQRAKTPPEGQTHAEQPAGAVQRPAGAGRAAADPIAKLRAQMLDERNQHAREVRESLLPPGRRAAEAMRQEAGRGAPVRGSVQGEEAPQFARRSGPLTEAERLDRAKQSLRRRRDDLLRRVASGDLERVKRARVQLDAEGLRLQAEHARAKQAFDEAVEKARLARRPLSVRTMEHVSGLARAGAISGYHTLGKLFSFSIGAVAERPLTELSSAIIERTPGMRRIAAKADMESGSHVESLARFYSQMAGRGMKEAWKVLRTGKSTDTALYGRPRPGEVHRWYDFFGRLHDAEKTPLFTGTMEAYRTKAYAHAIRQGLNPADPVVRGLINAKSYEYALADKLQEQNGFADAVKEWHRKLEAANPATGRISTEKVLLSTLLKTFVTKGIVKTPANYLKQTLFERSPIGLIRAFAKAGGAHIRGVESLTDQEANHITRLMKLGMVGTAMTLWGMYDATKDEKDRLFGGYYQPGDKRGEHDAGFGRIRVGDHQLPHWGTHLMVLEPAQMGSTIVRVARSMVKRTGEEKGYLEGVFQAALAPLENAPIVNPVTRLERDSQRGGVSQVASGLVRGLIPQLVQNVAEDTDKHTSEGDPVPRKAQSVMDAVKMGVPGVREQISPDLHKGMQSWRRRQIEAALRQ